VFQTITIATRGVEGASYTGIKLAVRHKKVYLGYRLHMIERGDPTQKARDIGPTKEKEARRVGTIAQLTADMSTIIAVFALQKDAAENIGQAVSAICNAVKYEQVLSGFRWSLFQELDPDLTDAWLLTNKLPDQPVCCRSNRVQQIDSKTGQVIHTYDSQTDILNKYKMAPKTLKAYTGTDKAYKGFRWVLLD
jgi:hypothetical protein